MGVARLAHRVGPLLSGEAAAPDPGQRHELDLLIDIEPIDERLQLFVGGVVRRFVQDLDRVIVDHTGGRVVHARVGLGVERPRLDNDEADLVRIDGQHGAAPWPPAQN